MTAPQGGVRKPPRAFVLEGSNNLTTLYRSQRNRKAARGLLRTWRAP